MTSLASRHIFANILIFIILLVSLFININYNFKKDTEIIYNNLESYIEPILNASHKLSESDIYLNWFKNGEDESHLEFLREKSIDQTGAAALDIASAITGITYQTGGTKVELDPENDRDYWYYNFVSSKKDSNTELYYDSNTGILYIYYNVKIFEGSKLLGVVGFRIDYDNVVEILGEHSEDSTAYLINSSGEIYLHDDQTMIGNIDIYDYYGLLQKSDKNSKEIEIKVDNDINRLKSIRAFPYLDSYLIVEYDRTASNLYNNRIFILIMVLIILNIIYMIRKIRFPLVEK